MTKPEIRLLQKGLNAFTSKYLRGLGPLHVDGDLGDATRGRIRTVKWYLGYLPPKGKHGSNSLDSTPDVDFRQRLYHPKDPRYSTPARIARGAARRTSQRRKANRNHHDATRRHGIVIYDGIPVAAYFVPHLDWARHIGHNGKKWRGRVVSGFRTPQYSESLCYRMCGRPQCPGRCAGMATNHAYTEPPRGAVDLSDYTTFREIIPFSPHHPPIHNELPNDLVHFSPTGR
jgi:hypothetical protein